MYIRQDSTKLTKEEAMTYISEWDKSEELSRLNTYAKYYDTENEVLVERVRNRADRRKTPNNFIPSAYYKTLVDSMSGYLFQNIKYIGDPNIMTVLMENRAEIKDMATGANALTYNKGIELLYTVGTEEKIEIKFTPKDPRSIILIYNDEIEPTVICAIWKYKAVSKNYEYRFDVIYKDEWQYYAVPKSIDGVAKSAVEVKPPKPLFFSEVPVIVYNTETIAAKSSFASVLGYIVALDWVFTGNANEVDRIVDALLVLGKGVSKEDLVHMDEWKALQGYKTEDRAEFLTKDMSPQFREYVSKLLIQEIHKHSHIVDWYSPDTGIGGAVSAKALKTRLFDMDMFSKKIEKAYRQGAEKRIRLIKGLLELKNIKTEDVEIIFNRSLPSDFEELLTAFNGDAILSKQTKVEKLGLDWETEKDRIQEEKENDLLSIPSMGDIEDGGVVDLDIIQDSAVDAVVLNGAQVKEAQKIAADVSAGLLPRESGIQLIMALGIPREQAELIVPKEGKKATE